MTATRAFPILSMLALGAGLASAQTFKFQDAKGDLDLLYGDKPVYRLMTRYDGNDSTKKVFHHVYGFHGEGFITKGAGRLWGHHRGIWLGWSDVIAQGKNENFWECPDGNHQTHVKYFPEREAANASFARRASQTDWISAAGDTLGRDIREVTAWARCGGTEPSHHGEAVMARMSASIAVNGSAGGAPGACQVTLGMVVRSRQPRLSSVMTMMYLCS